MKYMSLIIDLCVSALIMGTYDGQAFGQDVPPDSFQVVDPVTLRDTPWDASEVVAPRIGPPRDGQPTEAIYWPADKLPAFDIPPNVPSLVSNWQDVESIRFWFHTDERLPKGVVVLLMTPKGYFFARLPLDFTGWQQLTLPMSAFKPNNNDGSVRVEDIKGLAFRAQGYNLPPLAPGTAFWIDNIELRPVLGKSLATFTRERNFQRWMELAVQGNPLAFMNAQVYQDNLQSYRPPQNITSGWQVYGEAARALPIAFAAADFSSPHRARADLVQGTIDRLDWAAAQFGADGTVPQGKADSYLDPNINRFTLAALLDCMLYLQSLPTAQQGIWPNKNQTFARLKQAIDYQRSVYGGGAPVNDDQLKLKYYANQDLYALLIFEQSKLLGLADDGDQYIKLLFQRVKDRLYSDGGIAYIGQDTDAPVYHQLDTILLARYITLSSDRNALRLLKKTVNYWPLTLTEEAGVPAHYSAPWLKQYWSSAGINPMALIAVAGVTRDAQNVKLLADMLSALSPDRDYSFYSIYAMPYWTRALTVKLLQAQRKESGRKHVLIKDANSRGAYGREGNWYYGAFQGRGLRNTFVGGLMTRTPLDSLYVSPVQGAFRGARIKVLLNNPQGRVTTLDLSEKQDTTCVSFMSRGGRRTAAVLGARYGLQPDLWPNVDYVQTTPSLWQVTQLWRAMPQGMIGVVTLEAQQDVADVQSIIGELPLGPQEVIESGADEWLSGPLAVKIYSHFGAAFVQPTLPHNEDKTRHGGGYIWPGIELNQPINGVVQKGERFTYSVWVGPSYAAHPGWLTANISAQSISFSAGGNGIRNAQAFFDPVKRHCGKLP